MLTVCVCVLPLREHRTFSLWKGEMWFFSEAQAARWGE